MAASISATGPGARRELIGALPAVNAVLSRLGFDALLPRFLPPPGPRCLLPAAAVISVLTRNLACGRQPLYALAGWAASCEPSQLGLAAGQARLLNDDRAGRALDALSGADRASMMTALSLAAAREYGISAGELHNDSTSVVLYGACQPRGKDARGPRPARGHSKDRRPDLKQLVWILTVTADGTVPFTARLADGNVTDDTTHITTWEQCRAIAGRPDFLYVADSKLATTANMTHIDRHGGRFVSVLPRSRSEDKAGRDAIAGGALTFTPALSSPARRRSDPPLTWETAPAPGPSAEGYPITWIRSPAKRARDARARQDRIARAVTAVTELAARLSAPRCKLKTPAAITRAAGTQITAAGAGRWVTCTLTSHDTVTRRQVSRGRPGPATRYQDIITTRYDLAPVTDTALAARDAASDGCYPLITNDTALAGPAALAAYKRQPRIEPRHHHFKTALHAAPFTLNTPARIDALAFCLYAALLATALIERELRRAPRPLRLYPENRPSPAPTGTSILAALSSITTTILPDGTVIPPYLTPLQHQIITLLHIPPASYHQQAQP
jgi:hypothetical protein